MRANVGDISKEELTWWQSAGKEWKDCLLDSIMHSFNKYLLSLSQLPGTILDSKDLVTNKTGTSPFLWNLQSGGHGQPTDKQAGSDLSNRVVVRHDCRLGAACLFVLRFYLFTVREQGGRRRGRETSIRCLSHTPSWGPGLQPKHVPWLGIKPVTFQFAGQRSIHWTTPARAGGCLFLQDGQGKPSEWVF